MNRAAYEVLEDNALVEGLSPSQLETFYNEGERIRVGVGDILLHQGDTNNNLYLVLSGALEVYFPESPERFTAIILATRKPGDYVGEYAFIDAEPASATVKATQPAELFRISHDSVNLLFTADPDIGRVVYRNLLLNLVERLRQTDKELDLFRPIT